MTVFDQIAGKIISEQALIIGPLAWKEAGKVQGLHIVPMSEQVSIDNDDGNLVIDRLVAQYERLFGRASHEVCRDAARSLIVDLTPAQVPMSLR